jgi:hypothetical protein
MQCDRCKKNIQKGEEQTFHGQTLCEDCYMDALSPPKACDPWAVHSAKSFTAEKGSNIELTEIQSKILRLLAETNGSELTVISDRLKIAVFDLEREIATLSHMEKIRGELRNKKRFICLW